LSKFFDNGLQKRNVKSPSGLLLSSSKILALGKCLADQGVKFEKGVSMAAAIEQAGQEAKV
jgi:hypothetical protein